MTFSISPDAPTVPELLRGAGYSTYAVGKWHNTPDHKVSAAGERSSWPLQRGFERFYGFLGAEANYHSPAQLVEGNELLSQDHYPEGYFCTDDWTDKAISWLRAHRSANPVKPFMLYLASNAPHVPLHAKQEDILKYKGRYDAGWEELRKKRFVRQKKIGLIGEDWRLSGASPGIPAWNDLTAEARQAMAAYMELYAALVDNTDQNIGRLVDELERLGILEDTLIIITSDNGASSIGGVDGAVNIAEKRLPQFEDKSASEPIVDDRVLGGIDSYPAYPVGWGNACNTPFRFYKRTPMNGGIRVPLVVHWPRQIADAGAIRHQWVHVSDILPTLIDILGLEYPKQFKGYKTRGLDGVSFAETITRPDAASSRQDQYYELEGNRGYISGRWKIASLQPPGQTIDLNNWLLFDLQNDPTECDNLAQTHRDVLERLIEKFETDAAANHVYPLDNRTLSRSLSIGPYEQERLSLTHTFFPGAETTSANVVGRLIADRDYDIECRFSYRNGDEGVIFCVGDATGGIVAYVSDGHLVFAYRGGYALTRQVQLGLAAGDQQLKISHRARGGRRAHATVSISRPYRTEGASVEIDMTPTLLALRGEGLEVGLDRRRKVVPDYAARGTFKYSNKIEWVQLVPGPQAPGSLVNRAEEIAQLD